MGETSDRALPVPTNGELGTPPEDGKVLGTRDSQPLDFWVGIDEERYLQLDDVISVQTRLPQPLSTGQAEVTHFGVVDEVRSAYEGATFHSDVFRVQDGHLLVGLSTIAHVAVTRIEPEVFIPPRPGRSVRRAAGQDREFALYFDQMKHKFPAGLSRDGQPEPNLAWKDTVLLRSGETVDILLDVSNHGLWMAHCHIAEHNQGGMMFSFNVARAPEPTQ